MKLLTEHWCKLIFSLTHVHKPVAVVRGGPHGQHSFIKVPLIALHDELVGSANHVDVICSIELGHNVAAKEISCSSRTNSPACSV